MNTSPKALVAGTAGPQADGPCSWAVRRVCALPPDRNETKQVRPLLVGRTCVTHAPTALAGGTAALVGEDAFEGLGGLAGQVGAAALDAHD